MQARCASAVTTVTKAAVLLGLLAWIAANGPFPAIAVAGEKPGPLAVTVLSPADGTILNARRLDMRALVTGEAEAAEIALDGSLVDRIPIDHHAREFLLEVGLDLTTLAAGDHTLTVTAFQHRSDARGRRSASVRFALDPSLPLGDAGPIERALRPHPFAAMIFDGDRDGETIEVHGRLVFGHESDGIGPERETVVVALGRGVPALLLPGAFRCKAAGDGRRTCRFRNAAHPVVTRVELKERPDGTWDVKLKAANRGGEPSALFLRIGNDAGGAELETGALLAGRPPRLDSARQAAAPIGPAGGTIRTTDAAGVVITLTVPAGALTRETLITLTPLFESPLAGVVAPLHAGVKLEPEGLRFAGPVTLALDASAMGQPITPSQGVLLVTSPLTVQPLFGTVDPATGTLTAELRHFSTTQGGTATGASVDLNAVLRALPDPAAMTLEDVEHLVALVGMAAQLEEDGDPLCANGFCAAFQQTLKPLGLAALDRLVPAACATSPATLAGIDEIIRQEGFRQRLDAADDLTFSCREGLMARVIDEAEAAVNQDPSIANLVALFGLGAEATARGFEDLGFDARNRAVAAVRRLRDLAVTQCQTDQAAGVAELKRLLNLPFQTELTGLDLGRALGNCAIRVTPPAATARVGGDVQFTATVVPLVPPLGPVNWSVSPAVGGTIDETGRFTAGNLTGTFSILATSDPLPEVFGEARVTVTDIRVSVAPLAATLAPGGTAQFSATVTGTPNTAVSWTLPNGGGTISQTGLFTAGNAAGTFTVRATSVADGTSFAEATVTVVVAGLEGTYLGTGREFDGQDTPPITPFFVGAVEVIIANVGGSLQLTYRRQSGLLSSANVFVIAASGNSFSGSNGQPFPRERTVTGTLTGTTLTGEILIKDIADPALFSFIDFVVTR